jgi:hypothetical protein
VINVSLSGKLKPCSTILRSNLAFFRSSKDFFFFKCHSRFLPYGFYGTFSVGGFSFPIPFFLPTLSFLQVVRRGSGALSPATHAHSTSHSQTYTTLIYPWAPFPDGTRARADLAVVVERVSLFLPPPYRQPLIDIHTHPWPGGGSFLRKNPPPSVGFEPTSAGTTTSEHCLRQPCGHRATFDQAKILSGFANETTPYRRRGRKDVKGEHNRTFPKSLV